MADVEFKLDLTGGYGGFPVTPGRLHNLAKVVDEEIRKSLERLAKDLLIALARRYRREVRIRPRRYGEYLHRRLARALHHEITSVAASSMTAAGVDVGVFNLEAMRRLTSRPSDRVRYPGWFSLFEEGAGMEPSYRYGFAPLPWVIDLVRELRAARKLSPSAAAELEAYVEKQFQGRHGEGIMVELEQPLFFKYPQFGTAREMGVVPHPGFEPWEIWSTLGGANNQGVYDQVVEAINSGIRNAQFRLMREVI